MVGENTRMPKKKRELVDSVFCFFYILLRMKLTSKGYLQNLEEERLLRHCHSLLLSIPFVIFRVSCALCNCISNSLMGQGDLICFGRLAGFPSNKTTISLQHQQFTSINQMPHRLDNNSHDDQYHGQKGYSWKYQGNHADIR